MTLSSVALLPRKVKFRLMNIIILFLDNTIRLVESCTNDTTGAGTTFPFLPLGALKWVQLAGLVPDPTK